MLKSCLLLRHAWRFVHFIRVEVQGSFLKLHNQKFDSTMLISKIG